MTRRPRDSLYGIQRIDWLGVVRDDGLIGTTVGNENPVSLKNTHDLREKGKNNKKKDFSCFPHSMLYTLILKKL
ncbi:MAG: hypothetical protein WC975_15520 [Phycisphaerae bacterium]